MMKNCLRYALIVFGCLVLAFGVQAQQQVHLKKKDRRRDVAMVTTAGTMVFRLYDATPLHRDNFLRLVKLHYYDSVLFHRVIKGFMIQAGDPNSRQAQPGQRLGSGGPEYTITAEILPQYFHKKGALAAARMGNDVNPEKRSSGSQFYIVQGTVFTEAGLDSLENGRLKGRKITPEQRAVYTTLGGTPHLDGNYTVFGALVQGFDVLYKIADAETSKGTDRDRPLTDIRILSTRLIKRKKYQAP